MRKSPRISQHHLLTLSVFSFSLFTSAALMFAVQPMVGKMLLPLVGGSPSGWVVAMAFFQIALLAGYALAHLLSKLDVRAHGLLLILVLLSGTLALPFDIPASWDITRNVPFLALKVLCVLALGAGLPFLGLSIVAPTLQRLFAATGHAAAKDPYFLYAASNAGSFIGLFSYPLLLEPLLGLQGQALFWQGGFAALIVLIAASAYLTGWRTHEKKKAKAKTLVHPWPQRLRWLALAFVPASLMTGVTAHITTDVASAPLIWVVPLALYLLTHIAAFARRRVVSSKFISDFQPITVGVIIALMASGFEGKTWIFLFVHLVAFWFCAQMCHMRLANERPDVSRLTEFYLFLALGGALGGSFNAFAAPLLFRTPIEYPMMLIASLALHPGFNSQINRNTRDLSLILMALGTLALTSSRFVQHPPLAIACALVAAACVMLLTLHSRIFLYGASLFFLLHLFAPGKTDLLHAERNFFGVIKVSEKTDREGKITRYLYHGTTLHGLQSRTPVPKIEPVSYYSRSGPVGDFLGYNAAQRIGVIGLGTGTIACHTSRGRRYDFYDIDPAVVTAAREWFTFLEECAPDAGIYIGDGRLELRKNVSKKYDVLVLDAFSSDSIPLHLLTAEAFDLYFDRLAPGGLVAVHISNRFLNLARPLAALVAEKGLEARIIYHAPPKNEPDLQPSRWVVLAQDGSDMSHFDTRGWKTLEPQPHRRVWRDDYSNMLSAMRF